jgi:iron-sulfur cluster assembly accessory protein
MSVNIEVTKEAVSQVQTLIKAQKPGTAVRVFVQAGGGGGCGDGCGCGAGGAEPSGPAFGLAFDRPRNGDEVVSVDGLKIIVDPMSAEFVNGAKIDFVQSLDATGFTIVPPNQTAPNAPIGSGCGCGSGGGGCC